MVRTRDEGDHAGGARDRTARRRPEDLVVPVGQGTRPVGACPCCGGPVGAADRFCAACGTGLRPASASTAEARAPSCSSSQISPDGHDSGGRAPSGRDHQEVDLGLLAGVTDRGVRHLMNEDAMALAVAETAAGPAAVAVVCDGVSTSDHPDEASLAAAEAAARVLLTAVREGGDLPSASSDAVRSAREAVASLAGAAGGEPSATFISAVMTSEAVTVCWLGDSRAYWLAAGPDPAAQRLTRDDSLAEEMVAAGLLAEADALTSPQAHVVTRWVGADPGEPPPHVATFEPPGPGVVLLCSDGLWNYQPDAAELAALALPGALTDPLGAAVTLVNFALDAGGRDNITVVLAPFPPAQRPSGSRAAG
ncbi:MAG TPA: protein phosphatase 2C domain-containing protein [Streptosporangiaceae bacterium]|nr:protein phosphatase 2C domain-containing protein [Streptosporangiaceae bacterium]